ncbi:hypothetical protein H9Q10_06310 [Eikenella sp. S3360]|uniref:Uncharacterized protein n=1 Tax=Eikenella glucosivorans TaxID=2766967 RepID=A0ABS0NAH8_9NEIS|nr:hypothetical protein [Eikenella glucosivorans]MBH5329281.1 hypothetical protein [Eikenella glucosivorans]
MKRLLLLIVVCCLAACVSYETVSRVEYGEQVSGLFYSRDDNSVYALGEHFDYRALPCNSGIEGGSGWEMSLSVYEVCMSTLNWMLADDTRQAAVAVEIPELNVEGGAKNKISGRFRTYRRLSREQADALRKQHVGLALAEAQDAERLSAVLGRKISADGLYYAEIGFYGQTVRVENRPEILQRGRLARPLAVNMQYSTVAKQRTVRPIISGVAGVVLIPVVLIPLAPVLAIAG